MHGGMEPDRGGVPETGVHELPAELPGELTVLDVREQHEWDAGHVPDALHVPLGDLAARQTEVAAAVGDGRVLVVCAVGARSARATAFLISTGLDAVNLAGGMRDWEAAGRPLAR